MITDNMKNYDYEPLPTQNSATPMKQDSSTAAPALKRKWWVQKWVQKWLFQSS